ncbi:MAG: efflux RND transporter periplasmic adaptor subunit [Ferrovibrio sp.]|uniref:efflux RND transporter periplasmic adaptor subunit n=1 Tax=Ferrovibrio sp. TaxID=1917215 RepID=UPI00260E807A|nr:efflux RND transporter periplasmic adaptor subunit [Ferrovibrio sp.]MCW0234153.1 efflux RND transporter periplasmic adaptor subunit [Ferrovibrio sp.]
MKRIPLILTSTIVVALLAGGAWWLWSARADTKPAFRTQTVALGQVEDTVSAVGTLQPLTYVDVGTQVSGQLKVIAVDYGQRVEQGQLLALIDPTIYEARVAADQANLLALRAQKTDKQVQLGLAERQFERQKNLLAGRATSQDAYDSAEASRKSLQAQIAVLDAQIQQGESTLRSDQANLSYTKIYAPMTGTVVDITAKQGQTLNANQQAPIILRIADLDTMTVKTQVSEADVPKLTLGMNAYFTTLGQPDKRREGKLRQILPTPEVVNNVVLYSALFDVANPDKDLLTQMSAQVFFVVSKAENLPVVPMAALRALPQTSGQALGKNKYALRVIENGAPVRRIVEVAASNRVNAAVSTGLAVGEDVVIDAASVKLPSGSGQQRSGPPPRL